MASEAAAWSGRPSAASAGWGSGEVPARRRMPWEEDGDLQRQWEDEQKGPR